MRRVSERTCLENSWIGLDRVLPAEQSGDRPADSYSPGVREWFFSDDSPPGRPPRQPAAPSRTGTSCAPWLGLPRRPEFSEIRRVEGALHKNREKVRLHKKRTGCTKSPGRRRAGVQEPRPFSLPLSIEWPGVCWGPGNSPGPGPLGTGPTPLSLAQGRRSGHHGSDATGQQGL
jgi:hypothetical protein